MCGIVGYIGKRNGVPIVCDGLRALEYRGYDSAGIAFHATRSVRLIKEAGRLDVLKKKVQHQRSRAGSAVIGHTRWATHGAPTKANAHPQKDCEGRIFLVHNGIIENYKELKQELKKKNHIFTSDTDTEVIAHCIEQNLRDIFKKSKKDNIHEAFRRTLNQLRGAYALAVIDRKNPSSLYFARLGSPLVVGLGNDEQFVASDAAALVGYARKIIYVEERQWGKIGNGTVSMMPETHTIEDLEWNVDVVRKGKYPFFMLKEIFDAPETIRTAQLGRVGIDSENIKLGGLEDIISKIKKTKRLKIIACGTSYYAGLIGERFFEEIAHIPTEVHIASEFRYQNEPIESGTICLFISQSGETADTLASLRKARKAGLVTIGLVNVVGSTIARETHAGVYNHAGPEISVASTKAFISQLTILMLTAMFFVRNRGGDVAPELIREFMVLPEKAQKILSGAQKIERIARNYTEYKNFLYIGRGYHAITALEGALKVKEISYVHAEGYAAGEMKHGPIALIDKNFPTVAIIPRNSTYNKMYSNLEEIKARGGNIFAVATEGDTGVSDVADNVYYIPKTAEQFEPILAAIPLQLFAYYIAVQKGYDIDKPRNLAKSVTVE